MTDHPFWQLILECKNIHRRLWSSAINYVPRTYNTSADCIAKLGHAICRPEEFVWLVNPPSTVLEAVRNDNIV